MKSKYLGLFFLTLLLPSCGDANIEARTNIYNHSASEQNNSQIEDTTQSQFVAPPAEHMQFGFFSDNYKFTRNSWANYSCAQQRFPVRTGADSEIALLNSSTDPLAVRWQLLDQAKHSVRLQTLSFWPDEAGWEFAKKLVELHKKGIKVKIIIDPISNMDPRAQYMYTMMQNNGLTVEGFEILYLFFLNGMQPGDKFIDAVNKLNLRPHEKMLIVDAEDPVRARAIVGGTNISKHYFRIEPDKPSAMWRDRDVIVKGQAALDIAGHFEENYNELRRVREKNSLFNTEILWDKWYALRAKFGIEDSDVKMKAPERDAMITNEFRRVAASPVHLKWIAADKIRPMRNRPRFNELLIEDAYLDFIDSAQHDISIMNAYVIPSEQMQETLKRAVRRGVHVRILTNSRESSAVDLIPVTSRALYKSLLEVNKESNLNGGSLEIYEWMGDSVLKNGEGHHHGKYAIFDRKAAIVGSFNLEARSRLYNSENIVAVLDDEFAAQLQADFESEVGPAYSQKISDAQAAQFRRPEGFVEVMRYGLGAVAAPFL